MNKNIKIILVFSIILLFGVVLLSGFFIPIDSVKAKPDCGKTHNSLILGDSLNEIKSGQSCQSDLFFGGSGGELQYYKLYLF